MTIRVPKNHGSHTWYTAQHERKMRRHGSVLSSGLRRPFLDRIRITVDGPQSVELTYVPETYTEHVYLNTEYQDRGTDWTREGSTLSILAAMDVRDGDLLTVQYFYLGEATAGSTEVPTAPEFWYAADSLSLSNGDPVTSWPDSSANGNNASGSSGPTTFIASAVNGLPALRWASANSFTTGTAGRTTGSWTAFAVFKASSALFAGSVVAPSFFGGATNARQFRVGELTSTTCDVQALRQGVDNYQPDGAFVIPIDDAWHIAAVTVDVTTQTGDYWLDGTKGGTLVDIASGTTYSTTFTIGEGFNSDEAWQGDLAEIIGWGRALTNDEMIAQARALGAKYGIATP